MAPPAPGPRCPIAQAVGCGEEGRFWFPWLGKKGPCRAGGSGRRGRLARGSHSPGDVQAFASPGTPARGRPRGSPFSTFRPFLKCHLVLRRSVAT